MPEKSVVPAVYVWLVVFVVSELTEPPSVLRLAMAPVATSVAVSVPAYGFVSGTNDRSDTLISPETSFLFTSARIGRLAVKF